MKHPVLHHVSIRTANIHRAIAFYELLGFEVSERFTTGATLACWLERQLWSARLELLQIPEPHPAPDCFGDEHYVGYYHLSFDLTALAPDLPTWLQARTRDFEGAAAADPERVRPLRVLLPPQQQQIGNRIWEVAFIADSDGLPIELLRLQTTLNPPFQS